MFSAASPSPDPTLDHRVGTTHLRLTDRVGTPLGHTEVEVAQTGHAFGFGCIGFEFVPLAAGEDAEFDSPEGTGLSRAELETLAGQWFDVFNVATLPFYWGGFEPVRGAPRTAALLAAARWFRQRGATVKGHPLVWHTLTAPGCGTSTPPASSGRNASASGARSATSPASSRLGMPSTRR